MAGKQAAKSDDKADAKDAARPAPTRAGSKKLIAIGVAGALLLAASGAAAYLLLGRKPADGGEQAAKLETRKSPVFVDLDTFTVNLRAPDDERFMQLKLVAEMKDAPSGEVLKTMMPAVRSEILLLLSSKLAQDVNGREGKEALAKEIAAAANRPLAGTPAEKSVEAVNFTHLIIQ